MKINTPAALLCAGLILSNTANAQDAPAAPAAPPTPAAKEQPAPPKPAAPKPAAPAPAVPKPPASAPAPSGPPVVPAKPAAPKLDPAVVKNNSSYGFGYRAGRGFTSQTGRYGLQLADLDREIFLKGLFDALELKDPSIDQDDINAALTALSEVIKEREATLAISNKAAGLKFLEENKKREGVISTASGLQYEILKKGQGSVYTAPPTGQPANKQFMVIYRGTLIDGGEFDSSKGEPVPMTLNVIPGFKEALTAMPVGSKWRLFIPSDLAYKEQRRSAKLGPNSALIFDLELIELKDLPKPPNPAFARPPGATPRPPQPGASRPKAVSPPVRVPTIPRSGSGAKAVSPPVRIPIPPKADGSKTSGTTPPVRIPTNPQPQPKPAPKPPEDPAPPK